MAKTDGSYFFSSKADTVYRLRWFFFFFSSEVNFGLDDRHRLRCNVAILSQRRSHGGQVPH